MRTLYFISLLLFILINGCKNQEPKTPGSTNTPKSSAKEISNPTVSIPNATSNFNASNNTYTYTVPAGTSLTAIAFNFTLPAEATSVPAPGSVQDFTNPVTYTITAADGSKSIMTVVFSVQSVPKSTEKKILNFTFNSLSPIVQATIDDENKKITARVPPAVDITKLAPTIIMSPKASISPNSGVVQNFTNPVNYIVTAEDGSIESYQVTISKEIISQSNDLVFISTAKLFAVDAKTGIKKWESASVYGQQYNYTNLIRSPTIYDGKILGPNFSFFVAFNVTDGKHLWQTKQSVATGYQSPVIYNNKILVNSSKDLHVIDPDNGNIDNTISGDVYSPIMVYNDKVYYGGSTTSLGYLAYCFDLKTNQILWKSETNESELTGNPVYHNNNVIFENTYGSLFCFDANSGNLIWKISGKVSDKVYTTYTSPTVEGDMVFSTNKRFIFATNAVTGKRKWEFDTNLNELILEENSPVFGEGLVFSAFRSKLFAVDAENGTKKWELELSRFRRPPVYFDGIVYIGSSDSYLYAINAKTGEIVWKFNCESEPNSHPIILDKTGKVHYSSMSGEKN